MDSRESMMPAVETIAPEAPSNYQLAPRNDSSTQAENSTQITGPPGFSPMGAGMSGSLVKKKRGRPRKYGPDGVAASGGTSGRTLSPMPISTSSLPAAGGYSEIKFGVPEGSSGGFSTEKKKKAKLNSSEAKAKHIFGDMSLGDRISSGGSFTPHMVTVNAGEDVTSKIISFSKHGPRAICVLSALGVISHVTLRQASSSGGTVTYEGRFEILSLSGSFTPGEVGGLSSREGGMSIALSSPDGRVVGGLLGGLLTAAGPVQVIVASFLPNVGSPIEPKVKKQKPVKLSTPTSGPAAPHTSNVEHHNFNEHGQASSDTGNPSPVPPPNFQHGNCNTMPTVHDWRRAAADMNVSLRED